MASKSKFAKLTIPLFAGEKVSRKTSLIGSVIVADHVSGTDRILVVERPEVPSKAPRKRAAAKPSPEKPSPKSSGRMTLEEQTAVHLG